MRYLMMICGLIAVGAIALPSRKIFHVLKCACYGFGVAGVILSMFLGGQMWAAKHSFLPNVLFAGLFALFGIGALVYGTWGLLDLLEDPEEEEVEFLRIEEKKSRVKLLSWKEYYLYFWPKARTGGVDWRVTPCVNISKKDYKEMKQYLDKNLRVYGIVKYYKRIKACYEITVLSFQN